MQCSSTMGDGEEGTVALDAQAHRGFKNSMFSEFQVVFA